MFYRGLEDIELTSLLQINIMMTRIPCEYSYMYMQIEILSRYNMSVKSKSRGT